MTTESKTLTRLLTDQEGVQIPSTYFLNPERFGGRPPNYSPFLSDERKKIQT